MENGKDTNPMMVGVIVALVVGIAGGYYYGFNRGKAVVVVEQQQEADQAALQAQQQLAEKANPFGTKEKSTANPFSDTYANPFEGSGFNPFTQ